MESEHQINDPISDSKQMHGKSSYYHAQTQLPDEVKNLIQKDVLLNDPNGPRLITQKNEATAEQRSLEIKQYVFMNDGPWMKVIIDSEKYPALKDLPVESMKCTFEEEGFYFEAVDPKSNEKYALAMPRTREKIFPDKSKYYVRKNKIYIALHKQVPSF